MFQSRTHTCNELRLSDAGKTVTIVGWYENMRKVSKNLGFLILRDFYGTTQAVIETEKMMARLSGVNTKGWETLAYILCGTLAGIAAIFYVGVYTTVQPGLGDTFNNEAIAGCVMGGTSMTGGVASIGGTLIGVLIMALLQEGIMTMGLQINYQYIITGLIVLVVVYADLRSRRRRN